MADTITRRVYVEQTEAIGSDVRMYFELNDVGGLTVVVEDGDGKQVWAGDFDQDQFRRAHDDATYHEPDRG